MADSFGLKIGLEGEKEFKKALADINQAFKVLGSEMKLATSQFDKNDKSVEALAARNKVLRKEIDEQTTKIDTFRKALQNAATSFGENDRRTQNWQIQLNNAEAALNDMNRELDENEKAIKDGGKAAEESGSKFEGFGKVLKTVGVALGAVAVAAGAAAVKLGKEVIAAYADYEQLVGGVGTLFKDSSQEIQRYAANAYKTAGLSANEYMETVTGFSASLIQSLGGDTEKAAKYADMAITDMSDNANKMGTDMSSIQNAYQGFAKQNYTMLDNLKLGYHELTDSYDAEYFRYSVISGNLDIEEQLNKVGSFTVTFNCKPFKYSFAGQETVSADASELTITNPTAFESRPYIKLYGNGTVVIMIQPQGRGMMISDVDEYIEIDSELMNCFKGTILKNDAVKGAEFPVLKPGVCTINCTGDVTRIEVIPRWCCL